jgi:sporulation protein YlmC with PRC-barrel domain
MHNEVIRFLEYSKGDYELATPSDDILSFAVYDRHGEYVGRVEELLLDNSDTHDSNRPTKRRISLGVINTGGVLGHEQIVVPFEAFTQVDEQRREVRINYPKEFFQQEAAVYRGLNFLDMDAQGRLYGLYGMDQQWFDERHGADHQLTKEG